MGDQMASSWATLWTFSRIFTATQDSVCLVAWDHLALMEAGDLLVQWEEWGPTAGADLEVVLVPLMAWVASQGPMAWVMALLTGLHMAFLTMALDPMASLKVMASSLLLMANNLLFMVNNHLQLPTPLRSNLLDISHLNSLLTLSNLPILHSLPTHNSQLTHSNQPIVNSLPMVKVLQPGLNRHLRGSASSSVL